MLSKRKMKKKGSVQEYYFLMKVLAARGDVEDEALIQYIIDGMPNDGTDKRVSYGATKLRDFKERISIVQEENRMTYNLRRRKPAKYKIGDLVAIKRTQLGPGLKLMPKYLGPYKVIRIKGRDTYDVCKDGTQEGTMKTSTCAEYMKPWIVDALSSETDDL